MHISTRPTGQAKVIRHHRDFDLLPDGIIGSTQVYPMLDNQLIHLWFTSRRNWMSPRVALLQVRRQRDVLAARADVVSVPASLGETELVIYRSGLRNGAGQQEVDLACKILYVEVNGLESWRRRADRCDSSQSIVMHYEIKA
jgi:hypothetical protein